MTSRFCSSVRPSQWFWHCAIAAGHGPRVPVVQGYFNLMLGPVDTNNVSLAEAFGAANRFVEVTVSTRPPVLPRFWPCSGTATSVVRPCETLHATHPNPAHSSYLECPS